MINVDYVCLNIFELSIIAFHHDPDYNWAIICFCGILRLLSTSSPATGSSHAGGARKCINEGMGDGTFHDDSS